MAQGEQPRLREQASLWPAQIYVEREAAYPFARLTPSRCRLSSQAVICVFLFLALTASVLKRAPPSHNPHTRRRHLSLGADARSLPPYGAAGECSRRSLARARGLVLLTTTLSSACLLAPRSRSSNAAHPGQPSARARPRPVPLACLITPVAIGSRAAARAAGGLWIPRRAGRAAPAYVGSPPQKMAHPFRSTNTSPTRSTHPHTTPHRHKPAPTRAQDKPSNSIQGTFPVPSCLERCPAGTGRGQAPVGLGG